MLKFLKNIVAILLILILSWSNITSTFSYENVNNNSSKSINLDELKKDYIIISEIETEYWKLYTVVDKKTWQQRTFWDLVDIVMAWWSWGEFLWDPSWAKVPELALDTAAILPFVPNIKWIKKADEVWKLIKDASKKNPKIKPEVKKALEKALLKNKKVLVKLPNITISDQQLRRKLKHLFEFDPYLLSELRKKYPNIKKENLEWIPWKVIDSLKAKYKSKIENIIRNKIAVFEDVVWPNGNNISTYAYVTNNAIVHINRNTWAFVTAHPINSSTLQKMYAINIKVIPK